MVLSPVGFLIKALFLALLGKKKERLAMEDLFFKFSYRYNQDHQRSIINPFKYLKTALSTLNTKNHTGRHETGNYFVFEEKEQFREEDEIYLRAIGISSPQFIYRHGISNFLPKWKMLIFSIEILLLFPFLLVWAVFRSDKAKPSLILLELVELRLLSDFLQVKKASQVLVFSAFEKDIVFLCYYLEKQRKIKVTLAPSPNPISIYYQNVICDTFVLSAAFQAREYERLKKNWFVNNIVKWPPYGFSNIEICKPGYVKSKTLGFGSSGMALRDHLQHTTTSPGFSEAEKQLEICITKFIRQQPEIQLIVYLHPLEKANNENLEFSTAYHRSIFGDQVIFAPFDKATKTCLSLSDVCVAGFSSSQIERLYGGFKTLFAPMGFLSNHFGDSRLEKISANNYEEFSQLVLSTLEMDPSEFFEKYELQEYLWSENSQLISKEL
jgi:hypothetical protein